MREVKRENTYSIGRKMGPVNYMENKKIFWRLWMKEFRNNEVWKCWKKYFNVVLSVGRGEMSLGSCIWRKVKTKIWEGRSIIDTEREVTVKVLQKSKKDEATWLHGTEVLELWY